MTSQTIVKMEGISKAFAGIKALDNVQIDLRQGEIHALMGENGAGKSTLMKIMTGVYTRDSGKMYLQNQSSNQLEEVEIKSPLVGQKLGLSMVFQEFNLLENMNIAENIFIGREPLGVGQTVDKKQLLQNAVEELKKVNLDIDPNTEVSKLSCGQKQCVEIAKALSFNARVVVFDEPTASLSEKESQTLFKLIKELKAKDNMLISKIGQFKSSLLNKKALKNITGTFISDLGISLRNEEQEVKELSGGNQQKVVIAKWLAMKPNILIMDEPTRGIDIGAKSEIYALMRKMTEQGMSIIMISSEMSDVMQVSDRILVMHEGSISGELTAEEVTRNNIMQAAFGGVKE